MNTSSISSIFLASILILTVGSTLPYVHADDDEIEIEIEIEDGIAEVKVEFDDDEYEFKLGTTDIEEIIEIIEIRTGLSRDLIQEVMDVEVKEEDEDMDDNDEDKPNDIDLENIEQKIRASTIGEESEVKIELEFVTDTTNVDDIIDEIIENFALTRDEADDALKIQEDDDEELEEKFLIEIKIEDGIAEVEVELRYILDSIERDTILDSIVEESQLSRDQIEDIIDIETTDESKETENDDIGDEPNEEQSPNQDDNTELTQIDQLRKENEQLQEENQILKDEIEELEKKLKELQDVILEQIKVILDTLGVLSAQ